MTPEEVDSVVKEQLDSLEENHGLYSKYLITPPIPYERAVELEAEAWIVFSDGNQIVVFQPSQSIFGAFAGDDYLGIAGLHLSEVLPHLFIS